MSASGNSGQFVKGDPRCHRDKTPGSFSTGYDPRRAIKQPGIVDQMRQRTPQALDIIDYILNAPLDDKSVSWTLRKQCAELVLERGYGKAQSAEVLALKELTPDEVKRMSLDELARIAYGSAA